MNLQDLNATCLGECDATEEHIMAFNDLGIMSIEISRDSPLAGENNHLLIAGRLPDGRQSYVYDVSDQDGLSYVGHGPTPEEIRFLKRQPDGSLITTSPCPTDRIYARVLRYDLHAYMKCEFYANKMQSGELGMDPTGPFSWKVRRILPTS